MPNGGQISAGTGLRLQPTTPGTSDPGNAHLSGTLIADSEIWSKGKSTNGGLITFGSNPGVNPAVTNFALSSYPNQVIGWGNVIQDSNVIQQINVIGCFNAIGNVGRVGLTSWTVIGSQNTLFNSGDNGNVLAAIVIGNNNQANKSGTSNVGPIILGYGNNWTNITNSSAYEPGVLIGKSHDINGRTNMLVIGPKRADADPTTDDTIKLGNSTQRIVKVGAYDLQTGFGQCAFKQTANGTVANTAAETTLTAAGAGSRTLGANTLNVGSTLRIRARGTITDTGTPTLQLRVKIGATTYLDFGAVSFPTLTGTHGWRLDADITIRTIGAGGTALGNGIVMVSVTGAPDLDTTNTATTAINTTTAQTVDVTAQWGTANPANSIICTNLTLEVLG